MSPRQGVVIRWLIPLIGAGLAVIVLFGLYREMDFARFVSAIATAEPMWLVALAGTIVLEQWVRGWKWRQILFDLKPISSFRLFGAVLAGYGMTIVVPLGISPLVRSWLIARLENLRMASILTTTAIERFLDGIVFAIFAGFVAFAIRLPAVNGPAVGGNVTIGLAIASGLNLILFSTLLYILFVGRAPLGGNTARFSRLIDWLAVKGGRRLEGLRSAIREGIVWPRSPYRQVGAVLASVLMKVVSSTNFLWAGLAVGIVLNPLDYLFLMVFAGFGLVLARFIRVPGGFVIGSGFALKLLGVADEQALAMVLFVNIIAVVVMVGLGLTFLWRSGIDIRQARLAPAKTNDSD